MYSRYVVVVNLTIINLIYIYKTVSNIHTISALYIQCIEGEDIDRKGIHGTPLRAAKAIQFLTQGYGITAKEVVGNGIFPDGYENDVVLVKDIDIHSLCEHHMLPFSGKVYIYMGWYVYGGYIWGMCIGVCIGICVCCLDIFCTQCLH